VKVCFCSFKLWKFWHFTFPTWCIRACQNSVGNLTLPPSAGSKGRYAILWFDFLTLTCFRDIIGIITQHIVISGAKHFTVQNSVFVHPFEITLLGSRSCKEPQTGDGAESWYGSGTVPSAFHVWILKYYDVSKFSESNLKQFKFYKRQRYIFFKYWI
jgi:hypothetical protein